MKTLLAPAFKFAAFACPALAFAVLVATSAAQHAKTAAPDPTPLLFDRVRAFNTVVVATLPEGYEKDPQPEPNTNCVLLTPTVVNTLKGDKEGKWQLSVNENLPKLLAQRDESVKNARYLLVVEVGNNRGSLRSGFLYSDLARFLLSDDSLEKVVDEFMKAGDDSPATILAMCERLLGGKELSAAAGLHVNELLARSIAKADDAQWKAMGKERIQKMIDAVSATAKKGINVDSASAVLLAIKNRSDNPGDLKICDEALAEPARKWLAGRLDEKPDPARPDYYWQEPITNVVALLAALKDRDSKETLVKLIKDQRWSAVRPRAVEAIKEIFGADADAILAPLVPAGPAKLPKPEIQKF